MHHLISKWNSFDILHILYVQITVLIWGASRDRSYIFTSAMEFISVTMATDAKVASMSLREVLDGLLVAHRQDIHAYGAGHLNESNLVKPSESADRRSWPSAKKPSPPGKKRGKVRQDAWFNSLAPERSECNFFLSCFTDRYFQIFLW